MTTYTDEEIYRRLENDPRAQHQMVVGYLRWVADQLENTGNLDSITGWLVAYEATTPDGTVKTTALGSSSAEATSLANMLTIFTGQILESHYMDDPDEAGTTYGTSDAIQWIRDAVETGRITFDDA